MIVQLTKEILSLKANKIQLFTAESCLSSSQNIVPKIILFIGVFHGDEPEGEYLITNLMNEINKKPDLIGNNKILFIPVFNPDGKALNTRGNSNGVDLNRNFPTKNWILSVEKDIYFSGPAPSSELETEFLIHIIDEYNPNIIITLHTPYRIINYDGPAKELAEQISKLNNYPVQDDIGYPTPGSFGTYTGIERNIPTITLELPQNMDLSSLWNENKKALLYLVKNS